TMLCCGFSAVVGMGVLLFASNCFLGILQDSAAGNRIIESWPNKAGGGFNLAGMFYVLAALFFGAVIGLVISILLPDVSWVIIQLLVIFCTFPFFLVSCLENDSLMFPVSTITVRSVFARFSTWLAFYIEAVILAGIAVGATALIVHFAGLQLKALSFACAIILGPLFTVLLFIYFRLLGRLVWVCDEWLRSLEPEDEEEEDEEAGEE
ncbi:MAG: hypothetical protein PVH19_06965, partial [Planctomycetia bacterium]